jgi:penicillin amidase
MQGLDEDVEIVIDTWGVPHIYAQNRADMFFAQGFNAARDRLFQIDLWRRRGLGLLSEVLGPEYVDQDRAARLFLYNGDSHTEWLAYGSATKSIVTAFTLGINAYIGWAREDPARLPPEFTLYGYEPHFWAPEDATRIRSHGLFYNAEQELARALTLRDYGREAEELRQAREPADDLVIPDGLNLEVFSDDVLRIYRLGRAPVLASGSLMGASAPTETSGSNNWVISGEQTTTGRPILANDPHRAVTLPSLRYIAHLSAPGIDVIGGGEPALPGISIGHNGSVAFGLTIWPADQEDLYVYETNPEDPYSYRYKDEWERMRVVVEKIDVAGDVPRTVELLFTRHGPVIHEDRERRVAIALRAVWLEPGMAPYLSSLEYLKAENSEQFVDALNRWAAPAVNQVYATTEGTIGCKSAGLIPIRPNWDGSLPVPGDGRYEWNGFYDIDQLPADEDPGAGWLASANQMNLPKGYRNDEKTVTYDWYPATRYQRITAVLAADGKHSVKDSVRLQNDVVNFVAMEVTDILKAVSPDGVLETNMFRTLQDWSGSESIESQTALVFQIWIRRHMRPLLLGHSLRRAGKDDETISSSMSVLMRDESFSPDLRAELSVLKSFDLTKSDELDTLTHLVDISLSAAIQEIEGLMGLDRSMWVWGNLHHTEISHNLLSPIPEIPQDWKQIGPAPKPGSGDTVGLAAHDNSFNMTLGSTFRIVVDVGEWDNSLAMNSPGQSGDPRSEHYSDLFEPWLNAESFTLCYSREVVDRNAQKRFILRAVSPEDPSPGAESSPERDEPTFR